MAGRLRRNRNGTPEPLPEGMDFTGVFGALLQRLERIGNNHGNNHQAAPRQTRDKLLERFKALRPDKYDGPGEACKIEQWLREMDRIFETME